MILLLINLFSKTSIFLAVHYISKMHVVHSEIHNIFFSLKMHFKKHNSKSEMGTVLLFYHL